MRLGGGRERNEDERHSERERLRDRGGARASDDDVCRRERRAHLFVEEPVHLVALAEVRRERLALGSDLREVRVAGVMDDRRAAKKSPDRTRDGVIDRGRALASPGHEDNRPLRRDPELRATRLPRPFEKRAADRVAVDERAAARQHAQGPLERRADPLRPPGEQPVHASGDRVSFPDVDGHARDPRGERRR